MSGTRQTFTFRIGQNVTGVIPPHILSVGYDRHLMSVRSMVLRQVGYIVIEAYSLRDALHLMHSDSVDLVLICHTVPASQQDKLINAIREQRRLMPVLCITACDGSAQRECVNVENSPQAMIDAVRLAAQASEIQAAKAKKL